MVEIAGGDGEASGDGPAEPRDEAADTSLLGRRIFGDRTGGKACAWVVSGDLRVLFGIGTEIGFVVRRYPRRSLAGSLDEATFEAVRVPEADAVLGVNVGAVDGRTLRSRPICVSRRSLAMTGGVCISTVLAYTAKSPCTSASSRRRSGDGFELGLQLGHFLIGEKLHGKQGEVVLIEVYVVVHALNAFLSVSSALRILVLTVPSGSPVISAISECVRPSKKAISRVFLCSGGSF